MLFAETRGKLGRDGSRAHSRAEDLLTSTAFQLLRYLPLESGLLPILRKVRAVAPDGDITTGAPKWPKLDSATTAEYEFWPRWPGFGEPDVVVTLFAGGVTVGRLVVEVKLDAGKSGEANGDEESDEDTAEIPDPDQLRRYWQGLRARSGAPALGVVYLTSHAIPPAEELAASVAREPDDWLGWLSWRDVWSAVRACNELSARDLTAILAAKGLKGFDGFHATPAALPASGGFWVAQRNWFAASVPPLPTSGHFWTTHEGEA